MSTNFESSQTKENLMRAFAGESQARNRYTFAAEQAKNAKMVVLAKVFDFTAEQEREHAKVFYNHLAQLAGDSITVDGTYPIDIADNLLDLLKMAAHNEHEEFIDVYPTFAKIAQEEGFPAVAASFRMIAEIERTHEERFTHFKELVESNSLFSDSQEVAWMCLNCGHIHRGKQVPELCPVCQHDKGYFIRLERAPWSE